MEAAVHTSVIETKIPSDFTRRLAVGYKELSSTGGWCRVGWDGGNGPWNDFCVVRGRAVAMNESER